MVKLASNDHLIEELVADPRYEVRSDGSIWTCRDRGGWSQKTWRRADFPDSLNGYQIVRYQRTQLRAHRIIYRKFLGELDAQLVVNHIDGDKANNHPSNLELVTHGENIIHSAKMHKGSFGRTRDADKHLRAALVRAFKDLGASHDEIATQLGLCKSQVSYICAGKTLPEDSKDALDWRTLRDFMVRLTQ